MTFYELRKIVPNATGETWHQHPNGGGWCKNTARVAAEAYVGPCAIVHGGTILGGTILGGEIHGGTILGGTIRGGTWRESPIQIQGSSDFVGEASESLIQIGCLCESPEWWDGHYRRVGAECGYTSAQNNEYRLYLELIAKVRAIRAAAAGE